MRPILEAKGNLERVQVSTSNRLCPHASSPWDGRTMAYAMWGMLLLARFCVRFLRERKEYYRQPRGLAWGIYCDLSLPRL